MKLSLASLNKMFLQKVPLSIAFLLLCFLASGCQIFPATKKAGSRKTSAQGVQSKSTLASGTDSLAPRVPPRRQIPAPPKKQKTQNPPIYCEGDFLDYASPQNAQSELTLQFVYDQGKKIELILINQQEQVFQKLIFKVKQKESMKLAQTHKNRTLLATHPQGLNIPGFPNSKKIVVLIPLYSEEVEPLASLNFQNSQGEFVGGNQKLNCSFDL